ncbi:MAG: hypothetical protein AAFN70_09595 [Planctomycetota bacterium]
MRLTGLFDRPINEDCLRALRSEPAIENLTDNIIGLTDRQWNAAVRRLEQIELISNVGQLSARDTEAEHENPHQTVGATEPQSLDAHPLIREYFAEQLRREQVDAFRAGHSRLFDHLCESTPHRPDGIEGLQPLYQAVVHGCLAERQQEVCDNVYIDRILRGGGSDGFYSTKMLGAIGADLSAAAAFFDQPWTNLSPNLSEPAQAWLLNDAAYHLRALGRLTEAVQPMRAGLEQRIKQEVWKSASVIASNLSQLELTLGRVSSSVESARRSVEYADRSKNTFQRMSKRTAAADALHHFGEFDEAAELFAAAESLQKEQQPQYPLLYSLQGFLYCDLLLENAERSAWRAIISGKVSAAVPLTGSTSQSEASGQVRRDSETAISECEEVERRANKMFEWRVPDDPVLDIALDHLTLARVELYRALLNAQPAAEGSLPSNFPPDSFTIPSSLSSAVDGLRQAGTTHHLPRGLLTSAVWHFLAGDTATSIANLDEAQQIAERGQMPLFTADILLTRARLFFQPSSDTSASTAYPWPDSSPTQDLADARKIITDTHYHRRLP